jgi:hypothetical protein
MKTHSLAGFAVICALCSAPLFAQSTSPVASGQTLTTAMVGFSMNETARLNVLNMNPLPVATSNVFLSSAYTCTVSLAFYDANNKPLSAGLKTTVAPQTATSLDLSSLSILTPSATPIVAGRRQIRGVVTVSSGSSVAACNVKVSLEIFDISGSTVALTTDTSVMPITAMTAVALQ